MWAPLPSGRPAMGNSQIKALILLEHLTSAATMRREMGMRYWLEQAETEMRQPGESRPRVWLRGTGLRRLVDGQSRVRGEDCERPSQPMPDWTLRRRTFVPTVVRVRSQ